VWHGEGYSYLTVFWFFVVCRRRSLGGTEFLRCGRAGLRRSLGLDNPTFVWMDEIRSGKGSINVGLDIVGPYHAVLSGSGEPEHMWLRTQATWASSFGWVEMDVPSFTCFWSSVWWILKKWHGVNHSMRVWVMFLRSFMVWQDNVFVWKWGTGESWFSCPWPTSVFLCVLLRVGMTWVLNFEAVVFWG
jgi:hypothetical protein